MIEFKQFPRPVVLIGLHKNDVYKIVGHEFGMTYRIAVEDGKQYTKSSDFKPDRVNLYITDGIVTDYKFY